MFFSPGGSQTHAFVFFFLSVIALFWATLTTNASSFSFFYLSV